MAARSTTARRSRRASFGNIRKLPSGKYQASYVVDGTRVSLGTFVTKTEARNQLAMVQRDKYVGEWRDPSAGEITVAQYMDDWISSSTNKADSTLDLYARMLRTWIAAPLTLPARGSHRVVNLGTRSVGSLTPRDVREWHAAVLAESIRRAQARHYRQQTAATTVNAAIRRWAREAGHQVAATGRVPAALRTAWEQAGGRDRLEQVEADPNAGRTEAAQAYRVLHAALAQAVRDRILRESPCDLEGAMQADDKLRAEREVLSLPEVDELARHMTDRYAVAVWVAATCGLRSGEVFALQRKHVDLTANVLTVNQGIDRSRRRAFSSTKTRAGLRVVDMPPSVAERLRQHMRAHTPGGPDSLVFGTRNGRPLSDASRSKMMARARQAIGRERLTWHDLRHSAVTLTDELNAPDAVAFARHGHAGKRSAQRYQHQRSGAGAALAAQIDARIQAELRNAS